MIQKLRSDLKFLDKKFTHQFFRRKLHLYNRAKSHRNPLTHSLVINYNSVNSLLHDLFFKYGSDKGSPISQVHPHTLKAPHTYADLYFMLFNLSRDSVKRFFECGIGTNNLRFESNMGVNGIPGASLRSWQDYFPNAEIYGADIDPQVQFSENRIHTYYVDQTNLESINKMWAQISCGEFDIIIDDGLHTFDAGVTFFEASVSKLRDGGIYIIEDITSQDKSKFYAYLKNRSNRFFLVDLHRPFSALADNSVVVVWK
jgi:hypothetical protein